MNRLSILIVALLLLAGCSPFAPQARTEPPVDLPDQYLFYGKGERGPGKWWQAFASDELNTLVETALKDNFDIRTAWAKLSQAEAIAVQAGAYRYPELDATGKATQSSTQSQPNRDVDGSITETQSWKLGLAASYELDLWGRVRSTHEAKILNASAAREDLETAAVSVAAEVVDTWVDLISVRTRQGIVQQQVELNSTLLDLQMLRFSNGQASALDVSQQRQALAAARADLPLLKLEQSTLTSKLNVLLGRATAGEAKCEQLEMPKLGQVPSVGLPADLLSSRPDVRAAGLRLQSADWSVAAARANRLPNISISAEAAFSSGALDVFFGNWVTMLAANLTAPIFDGGRRAAVVDENRAIAEERLAAYAQTVAEAIKEVEDSLVSETREREYIERLQEQLTAARLSMRDASLQYLNGQSDYLPYLSARDTVQRLERQVVAERAKLVKYRVGLYRSLGGDWTRKLEKPAKAAEAESNGKLQSEEERIS